ncbi:MAG: hypothetical protein V1926_03550 [Candidatus Peregrinibacteria bacterium]
MVPHRVLIVLSLCTLSVLLGCSRSSPSELQGPASFMLPLYPLVRWTVPLPAERTFAMEGVERTVSGLEISAEFSDEGEPALYYNDSEYADEDFWRFMTEGQTIEKMGYSVFVSEQGDDRQFLGFSDAEGNVLLIAHLMRTTSFTEEEEPACPCEYTFTVFTNDPRVELM